jgi:hypothetical protein
MNTPTMSPLGSTALNTPPRLASPLVSDTGGDEGPSAVLQEALGLTSTGTCVRHPNCPVMILQSGRVMSCRVCFSEEKSIGIQQGKSFSAVVQQLQRMHQQQQQTSAASTEDADVSAAFSEVGGGGGQEPQTLESIMKRLSQVQNWTLRQKEKEVMSLQLTIHRLEQKVDECDTTIEDQKETIKALRRTIQQDLKIIKTMATQKEKELEQSSTRQKRPQCASGVQLLGQSRKGDTDYDEDEDLSEDELYSPVRTDALKKLGSSSPLKQMSIPTMTKSTPPGKSPARINNSNKSWGQEAPRLRQAPQLGATSPQAANNTLEQSRRRGRKNALERTPSTMSLDASVTIPEGSAGESDDDDVDEELLLKLREQIIIVNHADDDDDDDDSSDSQENEIFAPHKRSEYWTDADMSLASDPSKIFASFRGGLLDIPKSPPPARHDKRAPKAKLRIELDVKEKGLLQLPSMRSVVRSSSNMSEATNASQSTIGGAIPLNLMASTLQSLPMDLMSDATSQASTINDNSSHSPSKPLASRPPTVLSLPMAVYKSSGQKHVLPNMILDSSGSDFMREDSTMTATCSIDTLSKTEDTSPPIGKGNREVVAVKKANCQDKYGDPGTYTGTILIKEGLPHGKGKMNYESGRIYDGNWLQGHWNGRGNLLNPNGDTYDGEFVFDARQGHGVYKWDNGDVYIGSFSQDKRHGQGRFDFHNGNVYEGEFVDGMFDGYGKYTFNEGYYEGDWKLGRYDGQGELQYKDGGKYTGEFRNSVAHGFGLEVKADGTTRKGVWTNGKPFGNK